MSITNEQVSEALGDMTVLQLCELTRTLEEKWGVKAEVAPVDFYGSAAPAYGGSPGMFPEEEQTEFSVMLVTAGEKKIEVIKVVRSATGLGLKEAKDLVEAAPKLIKETIPKAEAEALKAQLEAAGAKVALQ